MHRFHLTMALLCSVLLSACESTTEVQPAAEQKPNLADRSLLSFVYHGEGQHEVELDGYGTCLLAHWISPESEGGLAKANHPFVSTVVPDYYNQNGAPIAYVRGSNPTLSARFSAVEGSQEKALVSGEVLAKFHLGDNRPVTYRARFSGTADFADGEWVAKDLHLNQKLPEKIGYSDNFSISWKITGANGKFRKAGSTRSTLYLLRKAPSRETLPMLHTPVDLACREAAGLEDDQSIIDAVWRPFAKRHVPRVWDGKLLEYYGTYQSTASDLRGLLILGSGQCTTWAFLLHTVLGVHGIDSKIQMIMPRGKGSILVANWAFLEGTRFITSGPNGICETTATGDDEQAITLGAGRPNTLAVDAVPAELPADQLKGDDFIRGRSWGKYLLTGPDGIVQTELDPEHFVHVVPLGFGVAQQRGYQITDPKVEVQVEGDDTLSRDAKGNGWVMTGANGILETRPQEGLKSAAMGRVTVSVGKGSAGLNLHTYLPIRHLAEWPRETRGDDVAHDNSWISTGPNGIAETPARDGEKQMMPLGTGKPDVPVIGPGPNGVLDTQPAGDDEILDKTELLALAGEDYPYLPHINCWPLVGVPGQQTSNPPDGFPNHVILTVGDILYDPSYGTGPFPNHATWEKASLAGMGTGITDDQGNKVNSGKVRREGRLSYMQKLLPPN